MKNEKILMIGPSFDCQGGISAVSKMLYDYLISMKYPVYHLGSTIEGVFSKRYLFTLYSYIKFIKFFFTTRFSFVHVHCSTHHSFYRKLFYIILAQILGSKILLHVHPERFYDFYKKGNKYYRFFVKRILTRSEIIIVLSDAIKKKFSKILPKEKICVLNNPVISSNFRCQKEKRGKMVLYLGWIIPEKGVYDILEAIPGVIEQEPSAIFVFCGTKEIDKLKSICENAQHRNHVYIREWVSDQEKSNLLSKSIMLILPSYTEGFPNVILEAMASCLPIITTPVGAIPEIIQHKINGFLIEPGDVESLKETILILLKNPELCIKMGKANEKLVKDKYDIRIIGKKLLNIYSQIC